MAWRVAKSLLALQAQVNALAPGRDRSSDGTIGNEAHAATKSDHNPNQSQVVTAMDITHDPPRLDARRLAEMLAASRDKRIKYLISNREILSSTVEPWTWRPYKGSNPHTAHMHLSVMGDPTLCDDVTPWQLGPQAPPEPAVPDGWSGGKGSWYSWFTGKYEWRDPGDAQNSNALGVPDWAQGIAQYDRALLGNWYEVKAPNGTTSIEQVTDIGPHPNTGRKIDVAAVAAERIGYSPHYMVDPADPHFPTDAVFYWRPVDAPAEVAHLPPKEQATAYYEIRSKPGPDPDPGPPVESSEVKINFTITIRSTGNVSVDVEEL